MRLPGAARRLRHSLVGVAIVVLTAPLLVGEAFHRWHQGHLGLGFHTDFETVEYGPGISGGPGFVMTVTNLTPVPLPTRACIEHTDTGVRMGYRYRLDRWISHSSRWQQEISKEIPCDWPQRSEWQVVWPGETVGLLNHQDAAGLSIAVGDRFRYTVFTLFDWPDDSWLQMRVLSPVYVATRPQ